jgi:ABC-type transport system involved in multi-copper enzyme maturation permease subunit
VRGPVWAIVADTWRQSRQQVVYLLLALALFVVSLGSVFLVKVHQSRDGAPILGLRWQENPAAGLEQDWDQTYRHALAGDRMNDALRDPAQKAGKAKAEYDELEWRVARGRLEQAPLGEQKVLEARLGEARARAEHAAKELERIEQDVTAEAQALVAQRSPGMTPVAKGVEVWTSGVATLVFVITMLGFVSAAAGYFPGLMKAGAIDLVLAKPVSRAEIFWGKYLGGLGLCAAALVGSELVVLVGLGLSTGVWSWAVFGAIPVTLFSAALLYAVVVALGIATRSTALSMLGGYAYYVVVDTGVQVIQTLDGAKLGIHWIEQAARISRWLVPGFGRLRTAASAAVLHIPIFEWQPILVGLVWLAGLLGLAYFMFRRIDF